MALHNGHVLTWMRLHHWFATQERRYLAALHWATEYDLELGGRVLVMRARKMGRSRLAEALAGVTRS